MKYPNHNVFASIYVAVSSECARDEFDFGFRLNSQPTQFALGDDAIMRLPMFIRYEYSNIVITSSTHSKFCNEANEQANKRVAAFTGLMLFH